MSEIETKQLIINIHPTSNRQLLTSNLYNPRPCPACGEILYGMPGGRDAHCSSCGYKDPCCGEA